MASCISELMEWDCPDMSVCGNDCTLDDGNSVRMIEDSKFNLFHSIIDHYTYISGSIIKRWNVSRDTNEVIEI